MALITKPTKTVKYSVADPSASYHSLKPLWKRSRAVLQGQDNVKAHDEYLEAGYKNILIPFSTSMSQRQYDFYKSEAELPGLTAQYSKVLISALLRKDSHLKLPEELPEDASTWLKNDFTLDGRSLFNFLDHALWEELQTSRAWVYVDRPEVDEAEYDNMTPEERAMIKPYPVVIKAENVINTQITVHPITRQKTLTRWVTRYLVEKFNPENPWHPNYVDTVCDHYLDEEGRLVLDFYEHPDTNNEIKVLNGDVKQDYKESVSEIGFQKVNTVLPMMFGERLMRIPAWPLNGQYEPVEPVLMPLVDREISLYNKVSRRNHLLYGAATYTPIVQSDMTDEEFEEIVNSGLGTWLKVRKDESITVLETPTAALSDMEKAIDSTVAEMAKMGIRMLSPETAQSGVALEIRNASQTAQLGTLNAKVSGTIRECMAFMLNWYYNTDLSGDDIEFQMSSDFAPMVGGEGAMRLVSEWYQSGIIARSTWINIAKYNDFLPADYSDEEAIEEIQTDPLAAQNNSDAEMDIEE
tara:strand:+ start:1515 stop:3086 length:1572 start_codon:yes stop_codon:yes gene_type:complete